MEGQRSEVEQLEQGHLASGKHKNIAHDVSIKNDLAEILLACLRHE